MQKTEDVQRKIPIRREYLVLAVMVFSIIVLITFVSGASEVTQQCNASSENIINIPCNITVAVSYNGSLSNAANCHLRLLFPNGTSFFGFTRMTNGNADGLYYYPTQFNFEGHYTALFSCSHSDMNGTETASYFAVHNTSRDYLYDINETVFNINSTVRDKYELWLYSAGRYATGTMAVLIANLLYDNATVAGETIDITITYPDASTLSDTMTDEGSGIYSYDFSGTEQEGDYMWTVYYHAQALAGAAVFTTSSEVADAVVDIKEKIEDTEEDLESKIEAETAGMNAAIDAFLGWLSVYALPLAVGIVIVIIASIVYFGRERERRNL